MADSDKPKLPSGATRSPIDPNAPLDEQIKALQTLIHGPKRATYWIIYAPGLSAHINNNLNQHNRSQKPARIRRYAKYMTAKAWIPEASTIRFVESGWLLGGQNRFAACVKSGVPFESLTVFGVPDAAIPVMDTDKNRNGADILHIAGKSNPIQRDSAVRWHTVLTGPTPAKYGQDMAPTDIIVAHKAIEAMSHDAAEMFEDALRAAGELHKLHPALTAGAVAAVLLVYKRINPEAVDKFTHDVAAGKGTGGKLVVWLQQKAAANLGRVHPVLRNANLILALNAYCNGKHPARGWKEWDSLSPFPSIPKP